jgi:nucleoside phosphorylase
MSLQQPDKSVTREDFKVAIICALVKECEAVLAVFDQLWGRLHLGKSEGDDNEYSFGSIGAHNVVLVHTPGKGKTRAASAASNCRTSFPKVSLCLVVGICGGVSSNPERREPMLLGDVVISNSIVQYDFGKHYETFERTDTITENLPPPKSNMNALLKKLATWKYRQGLQERTAEHLGELEQCENQDIRNSARYPLPPAEDKLFAASYIHRHHHGSRCDTCRRTNGVCNDAVNMSCAELGCDEHLVDRCVGVINDALKTDGTSRACIVERRGPAVHFGGYASGDIVLKSGEHRDVIAKKEKIIAFDMEGAGVWEKFLHCLVIKGISDYADSHKNKGFQEYAAATAAACMKAFLEHWPAG